MATTPTATTTTPTTTSPAPAGERSGRRWFATLRKALRTDAPNRTDLQRRISAYPPSRSAATLFLPYE